MRRGAYMVPPREPKATSKAAKPKAVKPKAAKPSAEKPKAETPKVDVEKLKERYLPPAEPAKERFEDERIQYYRLMAKAIWIKCSDCANGQASMTSAGYFVPKCIRTACSLYSYRDEFFKEEIRRGSVDERPAEGPRAGDAGKGKGTARRRKAVPGTADNDDNADRGSGVLPGPGDKEDPGVAGSSGSGTSRKGNRGAAGRNSVPGGGDTAHRPARRTRKGV